MEKDQVELAEKKRASRRWERKTQKLCEFCSEISISQAQTRDSCSTCWKSLFAAHLRGTISMICLRVWLNIASVSISALSACWANPENNGSQKERTKDPTNKRTTNTKKTCCSFITVTSNQIRNACDCRLEYALKVKSKPCWSPCVGVGCTPAVGCWRSGAPGTLRHPSGHPAPPQPGGSGRTCCRLDLAASCSRHPEQSANLRNMLWVCKCYTAKSKWSWWRTKKSEW